MIVAEMSMAKKSFVPMAIIVPLAPECAPQSITIETTVTMLMFAPIIYVPTFTTNKLVKRHLDTSFFPIPITVIAAATVLRF